MIVPLTNLIEENTSGVQTSHIVTEVDTTAYLLQDIKIESIDDDGTIAVSDETDVQPYFKNNIKEEDIAIEYDVKFSVRIEQTEFKCDLCEETFVESYDLVNHIHRHIHCTDWNKELIDLNISEKSVPSDVTEKLFQHDQSEKTIVRKAALVAHQSKELIDDVNMVNDETNVKPCFKNNTKEDIATKYDVKYSVHIEQTEFRCDVCEETFPESCDLINHIHSHIHGSDWNKQFIDPNISKKSAPSDVIEKLFQPDRCEKTFVREAALVTHQSIELVDDVNTVNDETNVKPCFMNDIKEEDITIEYDVKYSVHIEQTAFKCDLCEKIFADSQDLVKHIPMHIHCSDWYKEYTNLSISEKSVPYVMLERLFQCDRCEKAFVTKAALMTHQSMHTQEKPFIDDYCDKTVIDNSTLKTHLRIHMQKRPYRFDKALAMKQFLIEHGVIRVQKRDYKCKHCGEMFITRKTLNLHLPLHKKRQNQCDLRQENFITKQLSMKHRYAHVQKKTFKCNHCNKTFIYPSTLEKHIRVHVEKRPYQCNHCKKSVTTIQSLKRHQTIHIQEKPFWCKCCYKMFCDESSLNEHLSAHKEKQYQCHQCQKSFITKQMLMDHRYVHVQEKPFKCDHCDKKFFEPDALKRHLRMHMKELPYKCDQCKSSFVTKHTLTRHQTIHIQEKPFRCKRCYKMFNDQRTLNEHFTVHVIGQYKCSQCPKSFIRKNMLISHRNTHTQEEPFKCDYCYMTFVDQAGLSEHVPLHEYLLKPFQCDECKKIFCSKSNLLEHRYTHMQQKPIKCSYCDKTFATTRYLNLHLRIHTNERPYKCDQCKASLTTKQSLKKHLTIHIQGKPFKCKRCCKIFNDQSSLNEHLPVHMKERPYRCNQCKKSFITKQSFLWHQSTHTKKIKYDHCDKTLDM